MTELDPEDPVDEVRDSILSSLKVALGIPKEHHEFDEELIFHINAVLSDLTLIGIGPEMGFEVEGETTTWQDYLGLDPRWLLTKQFVYLQVKMMFDPPMAGYTTIAIREEAKKAEWKLSVLADELRGTPDED